MKKKHCYLVLSKESRYTYGAFPRTKEGLHKARAWQKLMKRKHKMGFVVK